MKKGSLLTKNSDQILVAESKIDLDIQNMKGEASQLNLKNESYIKGMTVYPMDSRTCAKKLLERLDNAINDSSFQTTPKFTAQMFISTFCQTPTVYFPILICHILVLLILHFIPFFSIPLTQFNYEHILPSEKLHPPIDEAPSKEKAKTAFLPLLIKEEDRVNRTWVVAVVAVAVIILLALISYIFLKCIKAGFTNLLRIVYHFNFKMYFSIFPLFFIQELVYNQNWAADKIVLALFIYNFCICGVISMFYTFPKCLRKFYLIILCAMTAIITIKLIAHKLLIPIVILFCLWDCYAVLDKSGPLNQILQEDGHNVLPVVFQYLIWFNIDKVKSNTSVATSFKRYDCTNEDDDDEVLEIGLGDFIFYSIVVGKAFIYVGLFASISCTIFLFIGVAITTMILNFSKNGFPALPIPLTLALFPLILSTFTIQEMRDQLAELLVFI